MIFFSKLDFISMFVSPGYVAPLGYKFTETEHLLINACHNMAVIPERLEYRPKVGLF